MPVTIAQFFERLRESEVVPLAEVDEIWGGISEDKREESAETLVAKLVAAKSLTAYQARALLEGRGRTLVLGDYIVVGEIGDNGRGQVYQARHRRLNYERSLKALTPDSAALHRNTIEKNGIHYLVEHVDDGSPAIGASRAVVRPAPRPQSESPIADPSTMQRAVPVAKPSWQAQLITLPGLAVVAACFVSACALVLCAGVVVGRLSMGAFNGPVKTTLSSDSDKKGAPPLPVSPTTGGSANQKLDSPKVRPVVNRPPKLAPISAQNARVGTVFKLTALATDRDVPTNRLSFSLRDAPPGASINAKTGEIMWLPSTANAGNDYDVIIVVEDDGSPRLRDEQKVRIRVTGVDAEPPQVVAPAAKPAETIENSLKMKLVYVPPGEFEMGSPDSEIGSGNDEKLHRVRLTTGFYMGAYEVTEGQFREFVRQSNHKTDAETDQNGGYGWNAEKRIFDQQPENNWRNADFAQDENLPVVNVSWNDATAFCVWLGNQERRDYRLPSEAEWEYACRAGTKSAFFSSDDPETLSRIGNVADGTANAKFPWWSWAIKSRDNYVFTAPVGKFRPNAFGLFDMHGNVCEWCTDWYAGYANIKDDPKGPKSGKSKVIRGGGWESRPAYCRSAYRSDKPQSYNSSFLGFRIVREQ